MRLRSSPDSLRKGKVVLLTVVPVDNAAFSPLAGRAAVISSPKTGVPAQVDYVMVASPCIATIELSRESSVGASFVSLGGVRAPRELLRRGPWCLWLLH